MRKTLVFVCLITGLAADGAAQRASFMSRKSGGTETTRWTLYDWLAQKQSINLMDMWLSVNRSSSLFEASLSGGPLSYRYRTVSGGTSTSGDKTSQAYRLSLFVSIIGIEGEYEETNHDMKSYGGDVALRLLGSSMQSTHLTVKYGLQKRIDSSSTPEETWSNQFAQADLNLYLIKYFGLKGEYRYYFPDKSSQGTDLQGDRTTAGVFIDVGMLRIYGDYFQEKMKYESSTTVTEKKRDGYEYGAKLFF